MNKDIVKGNWKEIKGLVKQQWGKLTDNEIMRMEGSYDELAGLLQKKYGYEKDRAASELNDFLKQKNFSSETDLED